MRLRWAAALASAAVVAVTAIGGGAALATPPVTLGSSSQYVLDDSDVLSSGEEAEAQSRLEQLKADTGLDLWVVYVDQFTDPSSAADWANQTAEDNNLGVTQYVLAIATEGRAFYLSGYSEGPLSPDQLATIEQQQIQPALAQDDWLGAVDAAAAGMTAAVGGGSGTPDTDAGGSGWLTWLLVIVVVGVGIVLLVMFLRRRKKGAVTSGPAGPPQPSIEELERRASSLLVETDDALKTSAQELGFAKAQFGDAATTEFEAALATAQQSLDEAFGLKQKLDDHIPDSDADTRAWNERIIALCEASNALLDEKAAAFDELRKLEQNAPEALARVHDAKAKAEAALAQASSRLQSLQTAYAPEALATVVDNPEQARARLGFADEQLAAAQTAIGAGDGGEAAVGIRAAEEAVGQATLLENAIDKLATDLAEGERNAAALVAELESDTAAASALPDADGRIAGVIASTRQQLDAARAQLTGTAKRPLAALQSLEAANTQIDTLVQGVRDAEAQAQRARQMVGQVMMQAQAQVSAAEDYITARRGAVGAQARTRLAEAGASLARAQALQASDPQQAMQQAQRADQLAGQAIQLAQNDVGAFDGGMGGMLGGGQQGGQSGGGMLGAVLGGIVLNSVLGGGGRSSGGMGGGLGGVLGGGGGRSSGGMRPGSFGGGGTRARRGGGRF